MTKTLFSMILLVFLIFATAQAAEQSSIQVDRIELACDALDSPCDCPVIVSERMTFAFKEYAIAESDSPMRCIKTPALPVGGYAVLIQSQPIGVPKGIERVPLARIRLE